MKALFDQTENTKWYVMQDGKVLAEPKKGKMYYKKPTTHKRGYVYIRTANGNYQLHRLVASAFLPNPESKPTVNHKDGNKKNNDISNLEWATYKENAQHALKNGFTKQMKKNEGNIKYTEKTCREVLKLILKGESYTNAGKKFNMPYSTVAHLARGSRREINV